MADVFVELGQPKLGGFMLIVKPTETGQRLQHFGIKADVPLLVICQCLKRGFDITAANRELRMHDCTGRWTLGIALPGMQFQFGGGELAGHTPTSQPCKTIGDRFSVMVLGLFHKVIPTKVNATRALAGVSDMRIARFIRIGRITSKLGKMTQGRHPIEQFGMHSRTLGSTKL